MDSIQPSSPTSSPFTGYIGSSQCRGRGTVLAITSSTCWTSLTSALSSAICITSLLAVTSLLDVYPQTSVALVRIVDAHPEPLPCLFHGLDPQLPHEVSVHSDVPHLLP